MFTAIENSVQTPAVASAAQPASRTARPIRVVTNANLEARERLRGLGFAVQVLDAAALNGLRRPTSMPTSSSSIAA